MTEKNEGRTEATKARSAAYSKALGDLKAAFPQEFDEFYEKRCVEAGVEFKRRLSPKEKARMEVEALLAQYPDLLSQ